MSYISFISAPGCLTAVAGSNVHLKTGQFLTSGVNQGYHQINWDNPGYPWLVTCPERVGTGATPTG